MALFTIRVELHGATSEQYEILHTSMAVHSYKRFVEGIDAAGAKGYWRLPTAEYDYQSADDTETAFTVRDKVLVIANAVKPGAWVLVTKSADRAWSTEKVRG